MLDFKSFSIWNVGKYVFVSLKSIAGACATKLLWYIQLTHSHTCLQIFRWTGFSRTGCCIWTAFHALQIFFSQFRYWCNKQLFLDCITALLLLQKHHSLWCPSVVKGNCSDILVVPDVLPRNAYSTGSRGGRGGIPCCEGPWSWEDVVMDSWVCVGVDLCLSGAAERTWGVMTEASCSFPRWLPVTEELSFSNWHLFPSPRCLISPLQLEMQLLSPYLSIFSWTVFVSRQPQP